ncbi:hypothetical protein [Ideonella sp. BN130291]|uniref:hypothetical protein n=1 Tax=Ideonella sp. BN130291 TaxID=3112940 RepID=UPI002E267C7C|nr:hypothetical protein [Ideonella sp. BN130291]
MSRWRVTRRVAAAAGLAAVVAAVATGWSAYRAPTLVLSYALDVALCGAARRPTAVTPPAPAPAARPAAPPPPAGAPPR